MSDDVIYNIPNNVSRVLFKYLQAQDPYTLSKIKERSVHELESADPNISQNAKDVLACIDLIEKSGTT